MENVIVSYAIEKKKYVSQPLLKISQGLLLLNKWNATFLVSIMNFDVKYFSIIYTW